MNSKAAPLADLLGKKNIPKKLPEVFPKKPDQDDTTQ